MGPSTACPLVGPFCYMTPTKLIFHVVEDMTPTMSERMCKGRKKKCPIGETVGNHTIQRVQEEKHKRKS